MTIIEGNEAGFFALCNDTARHISHCLHNNSKWFVNWGKNTLYYDKNIGENVWEYYFNSVYPRVEENNVVRDYIDLKFINGDSFRSTMNYIYSNFFILNDKVQRILEPHLTFFEEKKILGVHIRRTDKFLQNYRGTTHSQTPVDLDIFKKEIDEIVDNYNFIYLATDCNNAVEYMKSIYGAKLLYNKNCIRGNNEQGIHTGYNNISGYIKGLNVLTDMILLSKCKHLIRSSSNVSITSLYLNLKLTYLNVNEKYLNDSEKEII